MIRLWFGGFLIIGLTSGCGFYNEKAPEDPATVSASTVSWPLVSANLFERRCALCHSVGADGVNVSSYDTVLSSLSRIQSEVFVKKSMPPDSPLTPYESTLLSTWISAGTPYNPAQ
jgi:hypothetical protein